MMPGTKFLYFFYSVTLSLAFVVTFSSSINGFQKNTSKEARKEASRLRKEGWNINASSGSMEMALDKAWIKQYEQQANGLPVYLNASGNAIAGNRNNAEFQAIEFAKIDLASQMESHFTACIKANIQNMQLNENDANSVTTVIQTSKNMIISQLNYVKPEFILYRTIEGIKAEVSVKILYDRNQSVELIKNILLNELKEKLNMDTERIRSLLQIQ